MKNFSGTSLKQNPLLTLPTLPVLWMHEANFKIQQTNPKNSWIDSITLVIWFFIIAVTTGIYRFLIKLLILENVFIDRILVKGDVSSIEEVLKWAEEVVIRNLEHVIQHLVVFVPGSGLLLVIMLDYDWLLNKPIVLFVDINMALFLDLEIGVFEDGFNGCFKCVNCELWYNLYPESFF